MKQKKNRGITLVALVVTIIVLLILAAISINLVIGENGIITRSKQATLKTEVDSVKTTLELAASQFKIEKENGYDKSNEMYFVEKGYLDFDTEKVLIENIIDNPKTGKGSIESLEDVYVYNNGNIYYYDKTGKEELIVGIDTTGSVMGIKFKKFSTLGSFVLAIDENNDLWGWGRNSNSEISNIESDKITRAKRIDIGVKVKDCVTLSKGSAILDENGNIWSWGTDCKGELGRGEVGQKYLEPKQISNGIKFKEIIANDYNLYALDENGKLYGCGANGKKQLGASSSNPETTLKVIDENKVFKQIACENNYYGDGIILAVDNDNVAWIMGSNYLSGSYNSTGISEFQSVKTNVKKVQAAEDAMYILTNNGEIWSCGRNTFGELGLGVSNQIYTLTKINSDKVYVDIIAGESILIALDSQGKYYACGANSSGELLVGYTGKEAILKECTILNKIENIKNIYGMYDNFMFLDMDGKIHTMGWNGSGQLGNGTIGGINYLYIDYMTKVVGKNENYVNIAAGERESIGIDTNGDVYTWGYNYYGECGFDSFGSNVNFPTKIPNLKAKQVSSGCSFTGFIDTNGKLFMVGSNYSGSLGSGKDYNTLEFSNELIPIKPDTTFIKYSAGQSNSYAIDDAGQIWAWGGNYYGELGNGTKTDSLTPIKIQEGVQFKEIEAGSKHSYAIDSEGDLWSTGNGQYGALATGNTTSLKILTKITDGRKYSKIAGFSDSLVAIDEEGNAYTCGKNSDGQLGLGDYANRSVLTQVMPGTKFKACAASWDNIYLIDIDGNLWGAGANGYNELGVTYEELNKTNTFVKIADGLKFKDVAAKGASLIALTEDGMVYGCGYNEFSQVTTTIIPDNCFSIVEIDKSK